MDKEIRITKTKGIWIAELWSEHEDPFIPEMYLEDNVSANDYFQLQVEIGNKNWVDLLNK